jgi:ligand-binding sensor domain-containing protein
MMMTMMMRIIMLQGAKMSVWDLTASGVIRWRGMIVVVES